MYPEQGPVWDWLRENRADVLEKLNTQYNKSGSGTLRQTSEESLGDLKKIFDETGGTERMNLIEEFSRQAANKLGIDFSEGRDDYFMGVYEK